MKYALRIFIIICAVVAINGCTQETTPPANTAGDQTQYRTNTNTVATEETLELANLGGATFGTHDTSAKTAGDVRMTRDYLNDGFTIAVYMFGQALEGKVGNPMPNPNIEFAGLDTQITIVSAIDGIVGFVKAQADTDDTAVFLQPSEGSIWTVGYDHIVDVTVKQGDRVRVGQTIGKASPHRNGVYRYELQINKDVNGVTTFHCPVELLASNVRETTRTGMEQFITDWNTLMGRDVYGPVTSACVKPVLTVSEVGA